MKSDDKRKRPVLAGYSRYSRRGFLKSTAATGFAAAGLSTGLMTNAARAANRGGHFRMGKAHGQTTDTLDPGTWENGFTIALGFGIHGYLTQIAHDGSVQPNVAESWEASDDASVWRFKIRPGITFHDGKAVTGEDVVASINHHRGENSTSAAGPLVSQITDMGVEGNVVSFTLQGGNADFPATLADYHLPVCPAGGDGMDWQSGNGCGPYKLIEFDPGVIARFARNENDWTDERGYFDSIEMISLIDPNARTSALISGDVNAIDRVDLKTVDLLANAPGINIERTDGTQHYTFAMHTDKDPYISRNVRLALKYAINRQELVDKILFGYGSVGNDHPIGRGQQFFNKDLPQREYDPDKAMFHLKEAGMDSLSVSLSSSEAAYAGAVDAAVLYQNSAKAAGINIDVVREPKDGYWSDVWLVKPFSAVYWSGRPVEDQMFSTSYQSGVAWNDSFWSNKRFDELLLAARAELDLARRRAMYYEMQEIVNVDGGVIVPMFAAYVFATRDNVAHGDMAANWDLDGERWMERWWFT